MSYAVRHEGSPVSVDDLSAADVRAGLREGRWEPTDEVREDSQWVSLEEHPRFAEAAAEVEPPPRKHHPDETRLDMNPLIDVALVLLIFFILTTTYETIRKVLDLPGASSKTPGAIRRVDKATAEKLTIIVTVTQEAGQPVVRIENQPVRIDELESALKNVVASSKKTTMLLDASSEVDYGVVMAVMDAAGGAGIAKTLWAQQPEKK